MISARYDLGVDCASFDYFSWQVMAAAKGATEIVFDIDRFKQKTWSDAVLRQRFKTIIEPGPALSGLPYRFGKDGQRLHSPHMRDLVEFVKARNRFPRLRSVLPPGNAKYTVTLRRNPHMPHLNSNEPAWREFASEIGALVIEDFDVSPIGLYERMALYAGAEMNFGVPNGPMHLIVLSEYPMMMFGCHRTKKAFAHCGISAGASYPWARENQQTIWEPDDLPVIRRHFEAWNSDGLRRAV